MATITEVRGDLFDATTNIGHCVSADMTMGKGIALEFRRRFGRVDELQKQIEDKAGDKEGDKEGDKGDAIGTCIYLFDNNTHPSRYIFYLVTKNRYWEKPTYETMRQVLLSLNPNLLFFYL